MQSILRSDKQQLHDTALHRATFQLQIRDCGPTAMLLPQLFQAIQTADLQAKLTAQPRLNRVAMPHC
jgi:hypothetical protein